MATDYVRRLGMNLRAVRTAQGLSLGAVEEKSRGHWKAVVIGAYERGDRCPPVERLAGYAGFLGVAVASLLPETDEPEEDRAEVGRLTRVITRAGINSTTQAQRVALAVRDYMRQQERIGAS